MSSAVSHLGSSASYLLDQACQPIALAFDEIPYLVGSAMEKGDWRDVDVRLILDDDRYDHLFPGTDRGLGNRLNPLWSLLCVAISEHLSRITCLPVDFQIQRQTQANDLYKGPREPLGLYPIHREPKDAGAQAFRDAADDWRNYGRDVMFNRAKDDLTPERRVGKWLRARADVLDPTTDRPAGDA